MLDLTAAKAFVLMQAAKVKSTVVGQYWLSKYKHIWPEADVLPEADSDDERIFFAPNVDVDANSDPEPEEYDPQNVEPMSDNDGEPIVREQMQVNRAPSKVQKPASKQKKPKKTKKKRKAAVSAISSADDERDDEPLSNIRAAMRKDGNEGEGREDGGSDVDWKEGDMGVPDHIIGERVHKGVAEILVVWDDGREDKASWENKDYYMQWDDYADLFEDWGEAKPAWEAEQAKKSAQRKNSSKAFKGGRY
jgi:hypothetical protein